MLIRFFLTHIWSRVIRFGDALSQAANALIFNPPHSNESLSGHAYRVGSRWEKVIDLIFFWQHAHCYNAFWRDFEASNEYISIAKTRINEYKR